MPGTTDQNGHVRPREVPTAYVWEAIYDGGSASLPEYVYQEETGELTKHWFADIELARCTAFVLHALLPGRADLSVTLDYAIGQRLIFVRRYPQTIYADGRETSLHEPVHILGWQRTIHGVNVSHYTYVFPDGSLLLSDQQNAV